MKKWVIGSIVGAIIIFAWQFLSWSLLNIHAGAMKYHPAQDSIVSYLASTIQEEGAYRLPGVKPGASQDEHQELMKKSEGKPWVSLIYHKAFHFDMAKPMIRGFLIDLVLVFLFIYIITRAGTPPGIRVFAASIAIGLFSFLWGPYTGHNWFELPMEMIKGDLIDAFAAWGLCGAWLAWWLNRK